MGEQFILCQDDLGNDEIRYDDKIFHFLWEVAPILNEQQAILNALKEENDRIKTKGLDVLSFYESKLINVLGTEDFQSVRDEIWIVRQVLYEMGVINDE